MTVALDTNVLAAGFVHPGQPPGQLLALWLAGRYSLVLSEHILTELARTFEAPYFQRRLTPDQRAQNLALLRRNAVLTPITAGVHGVATHREDDLVLATVVSGTVEYLVTGDRKLQQLGSYEGVTILNPRAFLELLQRAM